MSLMSALKNALGGGEKNTDDENLTRAQARWKAVATKVHAMTAFTERLPFFPIERLQELKVCFVANFPHFEEPFIEDPDGEIPPPTPQEIEKLYSERNQFFANFLAEGKAEDDSIPTIELDEEMFVDRFVWMLKERRYSEPQMRQWFRDIDVDVSDKVSWEEFTSYMIYEASSTGGENFRSKHFVENSFPFKQGKKSNRNEKQKSVSSRVIPALREKEKENILNKPQHRTSASRLLMQDRIGMYVTSSHDGLIKVWNPRNLQCVRTINNSLTSPAHSGNVLATGSLVVPITDMALANRGAYLYACAVDKTIQMYETSSWNLVRRYTGRIVAADKMKKNHSWNPAAEVTSVSNALAAGLSGTAASLGTSALEAGIIFLDGMEAAPSTLDIAVPGDRELMYVGLHDGRVLVYPLVRHSPEIKPAASYDLHTSAISKLRYIDAFENIVSCSWDTTLALTDPVTGRVVVRMNGGAERHMGQHHQKAVHDFAAHNTMRVLASIGSERDVLIWNPFVDVPLAKFRAHASLLQGVAFDETDTLLLTLDVDSTIKVWDMRMYQVLQTIPATLLDSGLFRQHSVIGYDSSRCQMVGAGVDLASWNIRRSMSSYPPTHTGHIEDIVAVGYDATTDTVMSCDPHTIMSWEVSRGRRRLIWDADFSLSRQAAQIQNSNPITQATKEQREGDQQMHEGSKKASPSPSLPPREESKNESKQPRENDNKNSGQQGNPSAAVQTALLLSGEALVQAMQLDAHGRRLLVGSSAGDVQVYNHRNAQSLRTFHNPSSNEIVSLVALTNNEGTSKLIAVVTSRDVALYNEIPDPTTKLLSAVPERIIYSKENMALFTVAMAYPPCDRLTTAALLLCDSVGNILQYSATTGLLSISVSHPLRPMTRHHHRRLSSQKLSRGNMGVPPVHPSFSGAAIKQQQQQPQYDLTNSTTRETPLSDTAGNSLSGTARVAVEDLCMLRELDLFVSCVGDNTLYFWDLKYGELKGVFCTSLQPEECILTVTTVEKTRNEINIKDVSRRASKMLTACDLGFVYVWNISQVPHARDSSSWNKFDVQSSVTLIHVFRAHNCAITRALYIFPWDAVLTHATDSRLKLFLLSGQFVGYLGQRGGWNIRKPLSYGSNNFVVPDRHPLPKPISFDMSRPHSIGGTRTASRLSSRGHNASPGELPRRQQPTSPSQRQPVAGAGESGFFITGTESTKFPTTPVRCMSRESDHARQQGHLAASRKALQFSLQEEFTDSGFQAIAINAPISPEFIPPEATGAIPQQQQGTTSFREKAAGRGDAPRSSVTGLDRSKSIVSDFDGADFDASNRDFLAAKRRLEEDRFSRAVPRIQQGDGNLAPVLSKKYRKIGSEQHYCTLNEENEFCTRSEPELKILSQPDLHQKKKRLTRFKSLGNMKRKNTSTSVDDVASPAGKEGNQEPTGTIATTTEKEKRKDGGLPPRAHTTSPTSHSFLPDIAKPTPSSGAVGSSAVTPSNNNGKGGSTMTAHAASPSSPPPRAPIPSMKKSTGMDERLPQPLKIRLVDPRMKSAIPSSGSVYGGVDYSTQKGSLGKALWMPPVDPNAHPLLHKIHPSGAIDVNKLASPTQELHFIQKIQEAHSTGWRSQAAIVEMFNNESNKDTKKGFAPPAFRQIPIDEGLLDHRPHHNSSPKGNAAAAPKGSLEKSPPPSPGLSSLTSEKLPSESDAQGRVSSKQASKKVGPLKTGSKQKQQQQQQQVSGLTENPAVLLANSGDWPARLASLMPLKAMDKKLEEAITKKALEEMIR